MSCIFINRKCKVACKKENSNMMNQVRACSNMSALTPVFMKRNLQKLMGGGGGRGVGGVGGREEIKNLLLRAREATFNVTIL